MTTCNARVAILLPNAAKVDGQGASLPWSGSSRTSRPSPSSGTVGRLLGLMHVLCLGYLIQNGEKLITYADC